MEQTTGLFEVTKAAWTEQVRRSKRFWLRLQSSALSAVVVVASLGLQGCTPPKDEFSCTPPSQQPEICVNVSAASPTILYAPIVIVITVQSDKDVQGVSVSADMVPMSPRLGSFDKEPFWVVDLRGGEPTRLSFVTEIYEPGYFSVAALASVSGYDPIGDTVTLEVAIPTPTPEN